MQLLAVAACVMLAFDVLGCGAGSAGDRAASQSGKRPVRIAIPKRDREGDSDNPGGGSYDSDDGRILSFGHPADVADAHTMAVLVRRFYAANASADGARTCRHRSA